MVPVKGGDLFGWKVTTGLVESNGSLPLSLTSVTCWLGWLPRNRDQLRAERSYRVWDYVLLLKTIWTFIKWQFGHIVAFLRNDRHNGNMFKVVNIWNFLPEDVVNFSTLCSFKNSLNSVGFSRFLKFSWLFYVLCFNQATTVSVCKIVVLLVLLCTCNSCFTD